MKILNGNKGVYIGVCVVDIYVIFFFLKLVWLIKIKKNIMGCNVKNKYFCLKCLKLLFYSYKWKYMNIVVFRRFVLF